MKKSESKTAVALKYDKNQNNAPKVTAKGKGHVADKIITLAQQNNIPLYKDQGLVQVLEALELNTEIPPELYRAVAEVLAFIYKLNSSVRNK